jgi:hypothetical protein
VQGSETQWYKTCSRTRRSGLMRGTRRRNSGQNPSPMPKTMNSVIERFREKYGAADVKKYYSNFDAAVLVELD